MKKILFLIFILFFGVVSVQADEITINDIALKLKNGIAFDFFNSDGATADIVSDADKITINHNLEGIDYTIEFIYKDNVIYYNAPSEKISFGDFDNSFVDQFWIFDLLESIGVFNGYYYGEITNWLEEQELDKLTLSNNNIEIKASEDSDSNVVYDSLAVKVNGFDIGFNSSLLPVITIVDVTETTIDFQLTVDTTDETMCKLYRSVDNINFDYVMSTNCNKVDGVISTFVDDKLNSGTTYYYKSAVEFSKNFNEVVSVKTLGESLNEDDNNSNLDNNNGDNSNADLDNNKENNNDTNEEGKVDDIGNVTSNPQTGKNYFGSLMLIMLVFFIVVLIYNFKVINVENK